MIAREPPLPAGTFCFSKFEGRIRIILLARVLVAFKTTVLTFSCWPTNFEGSIGIVFDESNKEWAEQRVDTDGATNVVARRHCSYPLKAIGVVVDTVETLVRNSPVQLNSFRLLLHRHLKVFFIPGDRLKILRSVSRTYWLSVRRL